MQRSPCRPPADGLADPSPWAVRPAETLEPHNYWFRSPIQACDTILESTSDALQHRLLKKSIKRIFFQDTVALAMRYFNVAIIMGTFLG
jgi:hypothetical protein